MLVLSLHLGQRGPGGLDLRPGIDRGARCLASGLALALDRLVQLSPLAGDGGFSGLAGGIEIVALDDRDQLAGRHLLAFVDGQRLDASLNPGARHDLVGVHRADELQVGRGSHRHEVPDEGSNGEQGQYEKDPIACVHLSLTASS